MVRTIKSEDEQIEKHLDESENETDDNVRNIKYVKTNTEDLGRRENAKEWSSV